LVIASVALEMPSHLLIISFQLIKYFYRNLLFSAERYDEYCNDAAK